MNKLTISGAVSNVFGGLAARRGEDEEGRGEEAEALLLLLSVLSSGTLWSERDKRRVSTKARRSAILRRFVPVPTDPLPFVPPSSLPLPPLTPGDGDGGDDVTTAAVPAIVSPVEQQMALSVGRKKRKRKNKVVCCCCCFFLILHIYIYIYIWTRLSTQRQKSERRGTELRSKSSASPNPHSESLAKRLYRESTQKAAGSQLIACPPLVLRPTPPILVDKIVTCAH